MPKKASTGKNIFLSLALIGIVIFIVLILLGKISIPTSLGVEQKLSCKNSCQALGKGIITNATGPEDCEIMGGTSVSGVDDCCCSG